MVDNAAELRKQPVVGCFVDAEHVWGKIAAAELAPALEQHAAPTGTLKRGQYGRCELCCIGREHAAQAAADRRRAARQKARQVLRRRVRLCGQVPGAGDNTLWRPIGRWHSQA